MPLPPHDFEFWKRVEELFNSALEIDPVNRPAFIKQACGSDRLLREELESLLRASGECGQDLEAIVHGAASEVCSASDNQGFHEGERFGHYAILSRLGAGGMGQVYLADDLQLQRKVALKTLLPKMAADAESVRRFKQEAQAASALNHPNILTIYEVGTHEGTLFIASEFIDGLTVREKLDAGKVPLREVIDIAMQTAAGLDSAHAAGIIHRDIKPENILIRADGFVKIVDFGIARFSQGQSSGAVGSTTQPGMVMGSARYMSPEQARGAHLDTRTDIFSLGAVTYEMMAGKAPFDGETPSDLMAEILKVTPPALDAVVPGIPGAFTAIVTKAMSKDREQRYRTAGQLLADLKALREDLDFQAKLHATAPGASQRRKKMAYAALAIGVVAVGGYCGEKLAKTNVVDTPHTLAILPFRNIKSDPAIDFLGYSLADAVITKMEFVNSLTVRPSTSIDRYRNQTIDPRRVGAELNVDALLTGSFVKDGDDLRVNTQLIDVRHVRVLWRDTIDLKYEKLLLIQDRVAQQIITGLKLSLSPREAGNVRFDNPTNGSAYESYLRGVDLYALNDFPSAIDALEKSVALEPRYALTWAHLGRAYTTNASLQFGGREQYGKALAAYQKSIELNSSLIEPRIYMANLFTDTGRVEDAVPLLLTALSSNQNSAEAHWELGYSYRFAGLLEESRRECERARQIDPAVKINSSALNTYLYLGEYDKFLASLPARDSAYILFYRGFGEYYKRDYPRAVADFDRAFQLDRSLLQASVGEALADGTRQRTGNGLRLLRETADRIERTGLSDAEALYKVSQAFAVLEDHRAALRMLRQAIEGGFFCYPYFEKDPLMASLRTEPEFSGLMAKARGRYEQFKNRFSRSESR